MLNAYRTLPPLSGLIGFEAAARLGSFSRAAAELNVTQSAVSHQIRQIEAHLGQPMFRRRGRRIELTDAGHDLALTTTEALETLRQGVRRLGAFTKPNSVILMMTPALALGWYLPRLSRLRADLPALEPWLHTGYDPWVSEEAEIDIVLGDTDWADPNATTVPAFTARLWPLCSPDVAATLPDAPDRTRLDHAPLLHDESQNDWQKWFAQAGSARADLAGGLNFSDGGIMLQAAMQGQGICLGSEILAEGAVAQGKLVRAAAMPLQAQGGTYLNAWTRNFARPAVTDLWDWLRDAMARP